MRPESVLVPLTFRIAPFEEIPVPLMVIASATVMSLLKCKVAPEATVVAPAVLPKPFAWVIAKVPTLTVVAPV